MTGVQTCALPIFFRVHHGALVGGVAHRDDADYVYPADQFRHYPGAALHNKRNLVRQLLSAHSVTVQAYDDHCRQGAQAVLADWMRAKGKAEEIEVYEFVWQASDERKMIPGRRAAALVTAVPDVPRISIHHDGADRVFCDELIYFGREAAGNHVVVNSPVTSRRHAKIE